MGNLLADTQALVKKVMKYFSYNYMVTDPAVGKDLKLNVLPHLQARYLPVTLMEKEFGDLVYISQPSDTDEDSEIDDPRSM